jgi:hypothetical protein
MFVIFASGLKYVGVSTTALGWILCAVLLAAATVWLVKTRPWETVAAESAATTSSDTAPARAGPPAPGEP